ncbi:MAG: hypothetical protein ACI82N_000403 [Maricaulis sp.]|jgi:hypothetical protein
MTELIARAERFARTRHEGQTRKGSAAEPYILHPQEVARLTFDFGGDTAEICAAWLHDTVEDCPPTSFEEVEREFGARIGGIVRELTDDKTLKKLERKRLQLVSAPGKSRSAALVKLADKTSNLTSLAKSPPADWGFERRMDYLNWARQVVSALPFHPAKGLSAFHQACDRAELAIAEQGLSERQAQGVALEVIRRRAERIGGRPEQIERLLTALIAQSAYDELGERKY